MIAMGFALVSGQEEDECGHACAVWRASIRATEMRRRQPQRQLQRTSTCLVSGEVATDSPSLPSNCRSPCPLDDWLLPLALKDDFSQWT